MKLEKKPPALGANEEIRALMETLLATEQRLEELTGGEVDPVAGRERRTILLRRAQEELRFSEAARQAASLNELRALFDTVPAMIWFKDTEDRILRVNQRVADLAGKSIEELEGKPAAENYPQEAARHYEDDLEVIHSGTPKLGMVEKLRGPKGEELWVQTDKVPVLDKDRKVTGLVVVAQDISKRKRDEESLRASQANLAAAQRLAHFGSWELELTHSGDVDANSLRWSDEMFRIAGYEPGAVEVSSDLFFRLVHPDDRESVRQAVATAIRERREYAIVHRFVRPDGETRVVQETAQIFFDETTGQPVKIVGTAHDITERKQAETLLRASEAEFRALAEAMPQMVWITRPDGWNIYFSQQWMDYTGLTLAESLGHGWNKPFHPEDQQRAWDAWQRATATAGIYSIESRLRRADGVYRWWLIRGVPQLDAAGNVLKWFGTCTDIHDLKVAEESLRLLGSAVEQAKESIVITDAEINLPGPRIVFVNPAFTTMTGYSAEEAIGKTSRMSQGPHTDRTVLNRLRRNLERGEAFDGEVINYRKDGTEFSLEWQIAPIRNAGGTVTHFVAIQRDITERKRSEAQLEKTHQELVKASRQAGMAEVATGILHNVGNVLNSVNVASACVADSIRKSKAANLGKVVGLLREHEADLGDFLTVNPQGKQIPGYLAQLAEHLVGEQVAALQELAHLQKNIEHIKEIVAMQQGFAKSAGVKERLSVTELLEDALKMNADALARAGIVVLREFQKVPLITSEKHQVLQILVNLVRNAQQACEGSDQPEKRLTLRVMLGEGCIRLGVADNGLGILPENLPRIFSHGFTTKKSGHGFGLNSSALAAKEMGGALTVHSGGSGQGATFTLELPCSTPEKTHE